MNKHLNHPLPDKNNPIKPNKNTNYFFEAHQKDTNHKHTDRASTSLDVPNNRWKENLQRYANRRIPQITRDYELILIFINLINNNNINNELHNSQRPSSLE